MKKWGRDGAVSQRHEKNFSLKDKAKLIVNAVGDYLKGKRRLRKGGRLRCVLYKRKRALSLARLVLIQMHQQLLATKQFAQTAEDVA